MTAIPGIVPAETGSSPDLKLLDHRDSNGENGHNGVQLSPLNPKPQTSPRDVPKPMQGMEDLRKAMVEAKDTMRLDKVLELLKSKIDVNQPFEYKLGLNFTGCALTYAVKLEFKPVIEELLKARADANSTYFFKAGAEQVTLTLPAAGAAIAKRRLGVLKLLHEYNATLEGQIGRFDGVKNATLLYEASYQGCLPIIRYLLRHTNAKEDLHIAVMHQDDKSRMMTPLHVSAWRGHCDIVEELLKNGATIARNDPNSPNARGPPALADAIDMGYVDIVRMLIKSSADIFEGTPPGKDGKGGNRGIDYIFKTHNLIIIAAVAAGLRATSNGDLIQKTGENDWGMTNRDLHQFMMTPNCEEIFDAIFIMRTISDWEGRKRFDLLNALVRDKSTGVNISSGPANAELVNLFNTRKVMSSAEQELVKKSIYDEPEPIRIFIDDLLPGRKKVQKGIMPIEIRQCVLEDIHNDPGIAFALANGPNQTAFDHPGAKALVKCRWQQARAWYLHTFQCNLSQALIFLVFAFMLNQGTKPVTRYIFASVAAVIWFRNIFYEVMQMVGLSMLGHFWTVYANDIGNVVDIVRLLLTGFGIVMMFNADHFNVADKMEIRIALAAVMYLLWLKTLYCQRGFEAMGFYMLPILAAVSSTWNFMLVMIWPALGFANAYFMLDVYPEFFRALTIVYRMGFVGDFDIEEIEDIDPSFVPTDGFPTAEGSALEVDDPKWTKYHVVFVLFTIAVTLAFSIIMMNILIGVLYEAYNTAYSSRHRLFLQTRACIGFEHLAVQTAFDRIFGHGRCSASCRCKGRRKTLVVDAHRYLWYSRAKKYGRARPSRRRRR
jgi:hypothetical protein